MKNFILIFIFLITGSLFSQNIDSLKLKQFHKEIDSVKYSEADFIKFKKHFTENKKKYDFISKKAASGDKNSSDFFKLLNLSYEEAKEEFGEKNIKISIYSYYKSASILQKFKKLNSDFQSKIDSLNLQKEFLEKEILKDKKAIDSLRKN
ncbi:hypothetical protein [uncultured Winogradskyella sp.]|uniref:hypothetical protein n=1 Tax=uncultured Winogradskyella sp. TaxID=395353 RepID=UPI002623B171|nr:hypothetical protein [uncultured Winogradskyella sp.]